MIKVVLLQDVKDLGKKGEIVTVKEGYAINFLIPKRLGRRATGKDIKQYEDTRRFRSKQLKDLRLFISNIQEYINKELGNRLEVERKAASSGTLYDAIDARELKELLQGKAPLLKNITIQVNIPDGKITKTGQWVVELVARHHNIEQKLPLIVYVTSGSRTRLKSDTLEPVRRKF